MFNKTIVIKNLKFIEKETTRFRNQKGTLTRLKI